MASKSGGKPRQSRPGGDGKADMVSEALRNLWSTVEADPVPPDFFDLLDQLDARRMPPPSAGGESAPPGPGQAAPPAAGDATPPHPGGKSGPGKPAA